MSRFNHFLFIFALLCLLQNFCKGQLYFQPRIGLVNSVSKRIGDSPELLKTIPNLSIGGGLIVGKTKNKVNHQLSYFFYPITITGGIVNPETSWGTSYVVCHNFSYGISYNVLHWKRLDVGIGNFFHVCIPKLTWPSAKDISMGISGTIGSPNPKVSDVTYTTAYEKTRLILEPHIDVDVRLFKNIKWNIHWGNNFGFKNIYTMDFDVKINDVPYTSGKSKSDGSGYLLSTGFKFYLKNQGKK
jgi:hypothetical protein